MELSQRMKNELDGLEKELRCVICLEIFKRPNTLPCAHSFCQECIIRALDSYGRCPICKNPFHRRALIINLGLTNIVEHYEHLKVISDEFVAQRENLAATKVIPKKENVAPADNNAEPRDIMAPPPPKRRSIPSSASARIEANPDNVVRAMKQIQNADRILAEVEKMIEAQRLLESESEGQVEASQPPSSLGRSFMVNSDSLSSLPPAAQPRDSLASSTNSIFYINQAEDQHNIVKENRRAVEAAKNEADGVILIDLASPEDDVFVPAHDEKPATGDSDSHPQEEKRVAPPAQKNPKKRGRSKRELSALLADQEPFMLENDVSAGRSRGRTAPSVASSSRRRSRSNDAPRGRNQAQLRSHHSDESEDYYGDENDDDSGHYAAASFKRRRAAMRNHSANNDDDADPDATQRPPMVIVGTCLSTDELEYLETAATALGATVTKSFERNDVTHVVTQAIGENLSKRSVKFLQGILRHCWIVNLSWVKQSSLNQSWLPEDKYEIKGDNKQNMGGPAQSRLHGASAPRLFKDYRIVLVGNFNAPTRTEIEQLMAWAGADVVTRVPRESERKKKDKTYYVIDAEASDVDDTLESLEKIEPRLVLRHDWILDSLAQYKVLPTPKYQIRYEEDFFDE